MPRVEPDGAPNRPSRLQRMATTTPHGRAYQGAAEAVFSTLICVGIGYWADTRFGTEPLYTLIGAGLGFCTFVLRLLRLGRLVEELSEEHQAEGAEGEETLAQRSVASRSEPESRILPASERRPSGGEGSTE